MERNVEYKIVTGDAAIDVVIRMIARPVTGGDTKRMVETFLRFVNRYRIDVSRQPVALIDGRIVGYALVLAGPAASASVFLPEEASGKERDPAEREIMTGLLKFLGEQLELWDLGLIQTVVDDEASETAKLFLAGGFAKLCDLDIMEAAVSIDRCLEPDEKIDWVPFSRETQQRFERMILQSYEGSRDCPALTGLRTGREVLTGHRHSGIFERKGWWLLRSEGADAGVVLLNRTEEDADRLELIYMGLIPHARGLGLGKRLLSRAFYAAGCLDKKVIRLAVDRENLPAVRLYQQFGFTPTSRQTVLAAVNEKRRKWLAGRTD